MDKMHENGARKKKEQTDEISQWKTDSDIKAQAVVKKTDLQMKGHGLTTKETSSFKAVAAISVCFE